MREGHMMVTCLLCGHAQAAPMYDGYACGGCGQEYDYDEGHRIVLDAAQRKILQLARQGRPLPKDRGIYTDDERAMLASGAAVRVTSGLAPDVAFVLVIATRTDDDKSRFYQVGNLPERDAARLLTRAAFGASPDGVDDVLASKIAEYTSTKGTPKN